MLAALLLAAGVDAALLDYYARVHGDRYDVNPQAVHYVMRALADKHDTGAVTLLAAVLREGKTDQDRARAADALWILGDPSAVPDLVAALGDRSTLVAGFAASGLGDLGDASAVPPLLDFFGRLPDNKDQAKARVADALGKLSDARALAPLSASVEALKDPAYLQWALPALERLKSRAPRVAPHPLAGVTGQYLAGDGLYSIVKMVVERERYALTLSTDQIGSARTFAGRLSGDGWRLRLAPDRPSATDPARSLDVVRWGPRVYLLEEGQSRRFCAEVAGGVEPRERAFGWWLLRLGDESKAVPKGSTPEACAASRR